MTLNLRGKFIAESETSPETLQPGQLAMVLNGLVGSPGQAMGVLGLTYTQSELAYGVLEYQTNSSAPTRLSIRMDK